MSTRQYAYPTLFILALLCMPVSGQGLDDEINDLKDIISGNPDNSTGISALLKINNIFRGNNMDSEALAYYESVQTEYKGKEVEAASICLSLPLLLTRKEYGKARDKSLYVKNTFGNTNWAEESLYNLGELYLNVYEDRKKAGLYFKELIENYPHSSLVVSAKLQMGGE